MPAPRILVTGARGFIGRAFLNALSNEVQLTSVTCLSRGAVESNSSEGPRHIVADLATGLNLPIDSADVVVHIAGEKRDVNRMRSVNTEGTNRILNWSLGHGVKRFVFLSSVGVYGAKKNAGVVTELFPHAPVNEYERTKDEAEQNVLHFCRTHRIECVILQPSNVIGLHENHDVFPLLGFMRSVVRRLVVQFGPSAWVNYVSVEDVGRALVVACIDPGVSGTFILNESLTLTDIVAAVASQLSVRSPTRRAPLLVGLLLGELGTLLERGFGRSMPLNRERVRELSNGTRYDGSQLVHATRFRYARGVRSTLASMAAWYASAGML